jgi:hypothetical protein
MTFKHTNFADSPTMRSLEKLAKDKGLIKEESPLTKIASSPAKANLKPTDNLMENLLKLCSGLRSAGFNKYAEDLESTFMMYKQAASQCECDTDIVEQAHPKGSHKLDGVDGDALIETIIDQHIKDMQIVNKKPTGKLANSSSIINAVKISLADDPETDQGAGFQQEAKKYIKICCTNLIEGIKGIMTASGGHNIFPYGIESKDGPEDKSLKKWLDFSNTDAQNIMDTAQLVDFEDLVNSVKSVRNIITPDIQNNRFYTGTSFMSRVQHDLPTLESKRIFTRSLGLIDLGLAYSGAIRQILIGKNIQSAKQTYSFLLASDVVRELTNHLINPLSELEVKLQQLDYPGKKDKLPENVRNDFNKHIEEMVNARNDANMLISSVRRGQGSQIINPKTLDESISKNNAESPLIGVFVGATNLNDIITKAIGATNVYRTSINNLEQWLKTVK